MPSQTNERPAVVLIGHGAPATDCPPHLVGELMSLTWQSEGALHGAPLTGQAAALDATIRNWPRHAGNDPYKVGLERLADALRALLPSTLIAVGYNEFCRPSIADAIDEVIRAGASHVFVIPSMLTPGGVHAECDIPYALEAVRRTYPTVAITYLWPFDVQEVAALLAAQVARAMRGPLG